MKLKRIAVAVMAVLALAATPAMAANENWNGSAPDHPFKASSSPEHPFCAAGTACSIAS